MSSIAQIDNVHLYISKMSLSRSPESPRWETLNLVLVGNQGHNNLSSGILHTSPVHISVAIDREVKPEWTEFYGYLTSFYVSGGQIGSLTFSLMVTPT